MTKNILNLLHEIDMQVTRKDRASSDAELLKNDLDIISDYSKKLREKIDELKNCFQGYWQSEGCSCCQNVDEHKHYSNSIGELLNFPKHSDDSGYDFSVEK